MASEERFTLESESVGALPIVNWFLSRMGVSERLERFVPHDDARLRLAPATVIGVVLRNIIVRHRPVYAIGEWAQPFNPGLLGLAPGEATALNDDRVGRTLDRLFDADRATLITETVLAVVAEFNVELAQLHNDSTTITLTGSDYGGQEARRQGDGQACVRTQQGFSPRPQAIALRPHGVGRRGGAHCLPTPGRQHRRRRHPHPNLGRAAGLGRQPGLSVCSGLQALFERGHGPYRLPPGALRDHHPPRSQRGHMVP